MMKQVIYVHMSKGVGYCKHISDGIYGVKKHETPHDTIGFSMMSVLLNQTETKNYPVLLAAILLSVWCRAITLVNTLGPRQNGRHFADDIFKCIFINENVSISIKISLNFIPKGPIKNIPALVQIMAWRRPGDKPLSEAMMYNLLTHICVTRPEWVNCIRLPIGLLGNEISFQYRSAPKTRPLFTKRQLICRNVLWNLEAARHGLKVIRSLCNVIDTSATILEHLSNVIVIRFKHPISLARDLITRFRFIEQRPCLLIWLFGP